MIIGILREGKARRMAMAPETMNKFKTLGFKVFVESEKGYDVFFSDKEYKDQGVGILSRTELLKKADILLSLNPVLLRDLKKVKKGKTFISLLKPLDNPKYIEQIKPLGLNVFSLDMLPRTTLAQSMDILSSMASISGYRAVLLATQYFASYFPMMITSAGSIKPAKVLVVGAGVAGLQAISTAKRLGAQVQAIDTRTASEEEVKSLGAKFLKVEDAKDENAGGYGVEQDETYMIKQRNALLQTVKNVDIIICTALVRGKKAPEIITKPMVNAMKKGSVIVDIAAQNGGNCAFTKNDKVVSHRGVTIIGNSDLPEAMPKDASFLGGNNFFNFIKQLKGEGDALDINLDNPIIAETLVIKS